jgi:hypothetical protein
MPNKNYFECPRCGAVHDVDPKPSDNVYRSNALDPNPFVLNHDDVSRLLRLSLDVSERLEIENTDKQELIRSLNARVQQLLEEAVRK